jgi:hypothetical protein
MQRELLETFCKTAKAFWPIAKRFSAAFSEVRLQKASDDIAIQGGFIDEADGSRFWELRLILRGWGGIRPSSQRHFVVVFKPLTLKAVWVVSH